MVFSEKSPFSALKEKSPVAFTGKFSAATGAEVPAATGADFSATTDDEFLAVTGAEASAWV